VRHQVSKIIVLGPETGKHHGATGREIFAALRIDAQCIRKDAERKHFGQVTDRVERSSCDQAIDQRDRLGLERILETSHRAGRHDPRQHFSRAGMHRRIGLENDAWRAPWLLLEIVRDAGTARITEIFVVGEGRLDLGIAWNRPDAAFVETDNWARGAKCCIGRIGIDPRLPVERIEIAANMIGCQRRQVTLPLP